MPKSKNATFATCTFRGVTLILGKKKYFRKIVENSWWYQNICVALQAKITILSQIKSIVAKKNERNDNDNDSMSSGSEAKVTLSL